MAHRGYIHSFDGLFPGRTWFCLSYGWWSLLLDLPCGAGASQEDLMLDHSVEHDRLCGTWRCLNVYDTSANDNFVCYYV
jgi:hypothetical protein